MAERPTILTRSIKAPTVQPSQTGAPSGAFGDFSGVIAAGRGLQSVGNAGMDFAAQMKERQQRLQREHEARLEKDYTLQTQNEFAAAIEGVRNEFTERSANGEFASGGAMRWMQESLQKARTAASDRLAAVSADPIYKRAVTKDVLESIWIRGTDNLINSASAAEGDARMQVRIDNVRTMATVAFKSVTPGDHASVGAELAEKFAQVDELAVPAQIKAQVKNQLSSAAFHRIAHGITAGIPAPESVLNDPRLTVDQQATLFEMNKKLLKPAEAFSGTTEASKVLGDMVDSSDFATNLEKQQTAARAADFLAGKSADPAAKQTYHARISLKKAEHAITANNFEALQTEGGNLYQRLMSADAVLGNKDAASKFYDSLNIQGAAPEDRSRFIDSVKAKISTTLRLINTGQANFVAEQDSALSSLATAATAEFGSDAGISYDTARQYTEVSKVVQDRLGIPKEAQVHVPYGATKLLTDTLWSGDTSKGSSMITNLGSSFGSEALMTLANSMLRPSRQPDGTEAAKTDPKNRAFAGLLAVAAWDHAGVESGRQQLKLQPVLKQWMDDLANFEKNSSTFPRRHALAAEKAFFGTSYVNSVSTNELLSGDQIAAITSDVQSLNGIAKGLYWQNGQNNDLATGFSEMVQRILASKAYSAGTTSGEDQVSREHILADEAVNMVRSLSEVFTVIPSSGLGNDRKVYSLVPTNMVKEGAIDFPVPMGAADVADLSKQTENVLRYIDYYEPARQWKRGVLADALTRFSLNFGDEVFPLFRAGGRPTVKQLPVHLTVDWAKIQGVKEAYQTGTGGQDLWKDYVEKPENRFTTNSVAFNQFGAWRYNPKTKTMDAMIFPGRTPSDAAPFVKNPGPAQPLFYNLGTAEKPLLRPVQVRFEDIRNFDTAYRESQLEAALPDGRNSIEYIR